MICETCQGEGRTSRVFPGIGFRTAVMGESYYDEQGVFHDHDPNESVSSYSCSNGHHWRVRRYSKCACGWSGGTDQVVHEG